MDWRKMCVFPTDHNKTIYFSHHITDCIRMIALRREWMSNVFQINRKTVVRFQMNTQIYRDTFWRWYPQHFRAINWNSVPSMNHDIWNDRWTNTSGCKFKWWAFWKSKIIILKCNQNSQKCEPKQYFASLNYRYASKAFITKVSMENRSTKLKRIDRK